MSSKHLTLLNYNGEGSGVYSKVHGKEGDIVSRFLSAMRRLYPDMFCYKVVASVYQRSSLPDTYIDVMGHSLWIEFKKPGGDTTAGQKATMDQLNHSGAFTAVAESAEDGLRFVEAVMYTIQKTHMKKEE